MLILKTNADLPISVRNVGHSIGEALKRLEMTFFTELHVNEEATSRFEDHIYEMTSIGKNILRLGDEENFELDKLYSRLAYFQDNYSSHAVGILTDLSKVTQELEPIAAMLVNEINRSFTDEIQMSTVNRLNELQSLTETTAISTIAGMLRLDWSATSFIASSKTLFDQRHKQLIDKIRDSVIENAQSDAKYNFEEDFAKLTKDCETKILEFTKSEVSESVAVMMKDKYDELFIVNEDLQILKSNAVNVASNCLTRGSAKKMIITNLSKELETLHENLKPIIESFNKKISESDIVEIIERNVENVGSTIFRCYAESEKDMIVVQLSFNEIIVDEISFRSDASYPILMIEIDNQTNQFGYKRANEIEDCIVTIYDQDGNETYLRRDSVEYQNAQRLIDDLLDNILEEVKDLLKDYN